MASSAEKVDVRQKFSAFVKERSRFIFDLKDETEILSELGLDSIQAVEFIVDLEEEFGITINAEDYHDLTTFNDFVEYLEKALT